MQSRKYSRLHGRSPHGHVIIWRRKDPVRTDSSAKSTGFSFSDTLSPVRLQNRRKRENKGAAALLFAAVFGGTALLLPKIPGFHEAMRLSSVLMESVLHTEEISDTPDIPSEVLALSLPEDSPDEESTEPVSEPEADPSVSQETYQPEETVSVPDIAPENQAVLVHKTYTVSPSEVYVQVGNAFVKNVTDYGNNTVLEAEAASPAFTLEDTGEPQVLIMHTHTTECYMPYTGDVYDTTYSTRSTDNSRNMAAVGDVIAEQLQAAGIGVLHDVTQHDYPSYNGSYDRSAKTVSDYLEQYPSIKVVLDIHRDAIVSGDTVTAPVVETDQGTAAQVMIISGCDDGTMDYPNWRDNLAFAIDLQQQMESDHPGFTRPVLFDYRLYNQNLTTGSLLIEVGGHGNTLPQALLAGEWIGQALAELFKKV